MWHHPRTTLPHLQAHGLTRLCVVEREGSDHIPFAATAATGAGPAMAPIALFLSSGCKRSEHGREYRRQEKTKKKATEHILFDKLNLEAWGLDLQQSLLRCSDKSGYYGKGVVACRLGACSMVDNHPGCLQSYWEDERGNARDTIIAKKRLFVSLSTHVLQDLTERASASTWGLG